MVRIAALCLVIGGILNAGPAAAQFGGVFGDSPPRPPNDVPNGFPRQPPPVGYPGSNQGQYYPSQGDSQGQSQGQYQNQPPPGRAPAAIQSQPLAPPPGEIGRAHV